MILRNSILIVLIIAYFANYYALSVLYPNIDNDYEEFLRFYAARNTLYEFMFFLSFAINFLNTKGLSKSLSCFGMCVAFASLIDKGFYDITGYLWSDLLTVTVAAGVSIYIYIKWKKGETI